MRKRGALQFIRGQRIDREQAGRVFVCTGQYMPFAGDGADGEGLDRGRESRRDDLRCVLPARILNIS